jgi:hypothetical protein
VYHFGIPEIMHQLVTLGNMKAAIAIRNTGMPTVAACMQFNGGHFANSLH